MFESFLNFYIVIEHIIYVDVSEQWAPSDIKGCVLAEQVQSPSSIHTFSKLYWCIFIAFASCNIAYKKRCGVLVAVFSYNPLSFENVQHTVDLSFIRVLPS